MKLLKSNKSLLTGEKGQVALFVALIFQVLFLFFAMIINVGLVVHHKINLQTSADMAAYYGAMKQAELMNVIGHMNYQMRQSWKLLAWRYRILGTAGDQTYHPYEHQRKQIRGNMDQEYSNDPTSDAASGNFLAPPFCITYEPFNESVVPRGESTCKKTLDPNIRNQMIRLFKVPNVVAPFIGMASATRAITINLKNAAKQRCRDVGPYNYMIVGAFMLAYQQDQYVRRVAISRISRSMSSQKDDFTDIEGNSVSSGAYLTFNRNLTEANRDSLKLKFEFYNGLKNCGDSPSDDEKPAPWLAEIRAFPTIFYLDFKCAGDSSIGFKPKNFDLEYENIDNYLNEDKSIPEAYYNNTINPQVKERIKYIATSLSLYNDKYRFIMGFEKNPWCLSYVGVKASSNPKIPFAPSDLTLTASAYAKPFGGRIGPWYYKNWPNSAEKSIGSIQDRTDSQLPLRIDDFATLQSDPNAQNNPLRVANYSKYIGDKYGLTSWRTIAYMAKAFFNLSPKSPYRTATSAASNTDNLILENRPYAAPRLEDWNEIEAPPNTNLQKDILAWNHEEDKESGMRALEIAGLAPDQFDIAYYSIDPNFYQNYYLKLKDGLIRKLGMNESFLRPDLGARIGHPTLEKFSVKDQIKLVNDISKSILDFKEKLTYTVLNPAHLLTSWSNKSVLNYDKIDEGYFGSCLAPKIDKGNYTDPQENSPLLSANESVPGECVTGGRTGYSVKIISKDVFYNSIKIYKTSTDSGLIKNPPSDF